VEFFSENVDECDEGSEVDSYLHGNGVEEAEMAIVLAEEDEHGLIENVYVTELSLLCGLTLIMDDGQRQVPVLPAAFEQTVR
jgi:hypothetical protein